ncbi:unnamed protein product [Brachionus calyciflorus]|uniref:Endonuclease/exonuclease/phosphatase domain-containing protein n=1 Tax=Brachionus calyciflorus TaxID=104777 RepID=A0A813QFH0_9BILA|nr:unnamed protein product [Brachionus calyciflorus]
MIRVRLDDKEKRVSISVKCKINDVLEKELNLNRVYDEALGSTFERLYASFTKHSSGGKNKKLKKENGDASPEKEQVPLFLYDMENKLVPLETKNIDAWKENYIFKIKEQEFKVLVNLPTVKKINMPKILIAGMPAMVKLDFESDESTQQILNKNSLFKWYSSQSVYEPANLIELESDKKSKKPISLDGIEWDLIDEGIAKKTIVLDENTENKLIKVECYPKDDVREGIAVEAVTANPVLQKIDKAHMPMTERHKLTQNRLDSKSMRVVTYNILANCYSDTSLAKTELYPYCPLEYLDFKYRKILLINEIINYNADIIFLQECETDFLDGDLKFAMADYIAKFKGKGERAKEGEAVLFRSDRFKFINSFDITLSQELQNNPSFEKLWQNISKDTERKEFIAGRGTVLQVVQVESLEHPGQHFLLANTHLFFHPEADFIRLLQSMVSVKYLEKLKHEILTQNKDIKKIGILFAGDFNSDPLSQAFQYIFTQQIPIGSMKDEDKKFVEECDGHLVHSLNLGVYADFPFTNCIGAFEGILDYVFYESDSFELTKVIPLPTVEKVKEFTALPNKFVPSDHLALVFEFSIK